MKFTSYSVLFQDRGVKELTHQKQIKSMKQCPLSQNGNCVILCPFCEGRGYVSNAMYNTLNAEIVEARLN